MKRPHLQFSPPAGYTLVEILVATTLSLMLLAGVITMFGQVGESITDARAMLEAADRLRLAAERLQQDLAGVTVTMIPPRKPEANEGYFEYIEGPVGVETMVDTNVTPNVTYPLNPALNSEANVSPSPRDATVGDFDDILMFTTRTSGRPFVGKCASAAGGTIQSDVAEVAWFLRGRTLHRRVLLVTPSLGRWNISNANGFYANNDISVSVQKVNGVDWLAANSLGDLTRRECRFAHQCALTDSYPYDARRWSWQCGLPSGFTPTSTVIPALPTLRECSTTGWNAAFATPPASIPQRSVLDFWSNNEDYRLSDQAFATGNSRISDDVILTNVIGFDVMVWEPESQSYVNLGHTGIGRFAGNGAKVDRTSATASLPRIYDSWSTHYESTGLSSGDTRAGRSVNGLDDDGNKEDGTTEAANGVVDDANERLSSPPYPHPLRGIQVKIRVFEPDSRQIREVTVVQDFLPQ